MGPLTISPFTSQVNCMQKEKMDSTRKRGSSRAALEGRKGVKRIRKGETVDESFTADQKSMIAQTASVCNISPERLAAAISNLQNPLLDEPPVARKYKPRPERRSKMPQELEKAGERQQQSHTNGQRSPKGPIDHSATPRMLKSRHDEMDGQRGTSNTRNPVRVDCMGLKLMPSVVADCLAGFISPYEQDGNYEQRQVTMNQNSLVQYNEGKLFSEKNSQIPSTPMNFYEEIPLLTDSFNDFVQPQHSFECDPFAFEPYTDFSLFQYPPLQTTQPLNSFPQMAYPHIELNQSDYTTGLYVSTDNEPYYSEGFHSSENEKPHFLSPEDENHRTSSVSAESEGSRSPNRSKVPRSSVDRVQTAQTRQLAACIRCKMQRIRCIPDPVDPKGICITCKKVSKSKFSKILCHRYRITDARLFKQGYLPGRVWTTRFQTMELNDIDSWDSSEVKTLHITYDYSPRPLIIEVKRFKPQERDLVHRSWKHRGVKKSVLIPPYAIASFEAAEKIYEDYINQEGDCFFDTTIDKGNKLLRETMSAAIKASNCAMTEPERILLKKILRLWVAGRFICRSERICGSETLGLPHNLIDETNPALHGKIPIPPVMGAQIDLIVISRILAPLRANILEKLQKMILENKPRNWFCIYLCIFVLLHNCALMTQQDTAYAKKHGLKTRFAMIDLIDELHYGANILLGYFHYCTKGFHPFSLDWNAEETVLMAELNPEQVEFVKKTAAHVKANESGFRELFDKERYDDDLYFVAQMYEQDWRPRQTNLNAPAEPRYV